MVGIRLFGGICVEAEDELRVTPPGADAQLLLAYLALHKGQTLRKDEVARQVWGEGDGRDSFRTALSKLRRALRDAGFDPD